MSDGNPYEVRTGSLEEHPTRDDDGTTAEVSTRTIELLNQTRPWVRLIGILFWIGTALLAIGSVGIVIGGLLTLNPMFLILAVVYPVMAVLYGAFARSLTTYARKINDLNDFKKVDYLEDALEAQKNFWKLAGIVILVGIILYILALLLVFAGVVLGNLARN